MTLCDLYNRPMAECGCVPCRNWTRRQAEALVDRLLTKDCHHCDVLRVADVPEPLIAANHAGHKVMMGAAA